MNAVKLNAEVPELMGASEVAKELGVLQSNIDRVANLPPAIVALTRGRVWRADVIREFAYQRRQRTAKSAAG